MKINSKILQSIAIEQIDRESLERKALSFIKAQRDLPVVPSYIQDTGPASPQTVSRALASTGESLSDWSKRCVAYSPSLLGLGLMAASKDPEEFACQQVWEKIVQSGIFSQSHSDFENERAADWVKGVEAGSPRGLDHSRFLRDFGQLNQSGARGPGEHSGQNLLDLVNSNSMSVLRLGRSVVGRLTQKLSQQDLGLGILNCDQAIDQSQAPHLLAQELVRVLDESTGGAINKINKSDDHLNNASAHGSTNEPSEGSLWNKQEFFLRENIHRLAYLGTMVTLESLCRKIEAELLHDPVRHNLSIQQMVSEMIIRSRAIAMESNVACESESAMREFFRLEMLAAIYQSAQDFGPSDRSKVCGLSKTQERVAILNALNRINARDLKMAQGAAVAGADQATQESSECEPFDPHWFSQEEIDLRTGQLTVDQWFDQAHAQYLADTAFQQVCRDETWSPHGSERFPIDSLDDLREALAVFSQQRQDLGTTPSPHLPI